MLLDRRMAARRRDVQEDGARHRLRRLMYVLLVMALVAGGIWLLFSPLMAVDEILLVGTARSNASEILADSGVEPGVPTVSIRARRVEEALRLDPWIIDADVAVTWPGTVEVVILEHRPVAWVAADGQWLLVAATGDILRAAGEPPPTAARIELLGTPAGRPGTVVDDPAAAGAARFVANLPAALRPGIVITGTARSLWAQADGHQVRLGRAVEMVEKAAALGAILDGAVESGVTIDLITPSWPAIGPNPEAEVEGEGEGLAEPQPEN
jgi:cell division septal protein FtsQ